METLIHADIFFFISSIGFIIVFALVAVALIALIRLFRTIERITAKIEKNVEDISEDTKELIADLRSSRIFSWIFGTSRARRK